MSFINSDWDVRSIWDFADSKCAITRAVLMFSSHFGENMFGKSTGKLRWADYRLSGHGADLEKVKTIGSAEGGRYRVDLSHQ